MSYFNDLIYQTFSRLNQRWNRIAIGGLLMSLPVIPLAASAQSLNPCPGIYYEGPFNQTRIVPEGCPPNAATSQELSELNDTSELETAPIPGVPSSSTIIEPSLTESPEPFEETIVGIVSNEESVNIRLINQTDATIVFQLSNDAQQRTTMGIIQGTGVTLRELEAPVDLTFIRQDGSILQVVPRVVSPTVVEVTLDEAATGADLATGNLVIEADGTVTLN